MRTGGWSYPVQRRDWEDLADRYRAAPAVVSSIAQVIDSIVSSGLGDELQFATSMWDLIVTSSPASAPPVDVVAVRGAMGAKRVPADRIVVEHLPLVGLADAIERDASDAVPLFWAFMREKYGLIRQP
jgi:hypothetical protein